MSNIASVLKSEITRLARKESRAETASLKKGSTTHRSEIAELKRRVGELERLIRMISKTSTRAVQQIPGEEAGVAHRFSPKGLASLRRRLDLSADQLGKVLGTSGQSIYNWEQGTTRPRAETLAKLASLRSVGKREVVRYLESLG